MITIPFRINTYTKTRGGNPIPSAPIWQFLSSLRGRSLQLRIELHCGFEFLRRALFVAFSLQRQAELVMGGSVARHRFDGAAKLRNRAVDIPCVEQALS